MDTNVTKPAEATDADTVKFARLRNAVTKRRVQKAATLLIAAGGGYLLHSYVTRSENDAPEVDAETADEA